MLKVKQVGKNVAFKDFSQKIDLFDTCAHIDLFSRAFLFAELKKTFATNSTPEG